jgi:hypothetical protein
MLDQILKYIIKNSNSFYIKIPKQKITYLINQYKKVTTVQFKHLVSIFLFLLFVLFGFLLKQ